MLGRHAGALLAAALLFGGAARAEGPAAPPPSPPPAAAPSAASPPSAAPPAAERPRGVVVLALDDDASAAARSLARELYADAALRPALDEKTASVLAGEPVADGAPAKLRELAELRRAVAAAGSEAAARHLVASVGAAVGASVVVTVSTQGGRPSARVVRVAGAAAQPLELGATIEGPAEGPKVYRWPGAVAALRPMLAGGAAPAAVLAKAESTPMPAPVPAKEKSNEGGFFSSPWFWGPVAGLAAAGIAVIIVAKTTESDVDTMRLQGRAAP